WYDGERTAVVESPMDVSCAAAQSLAVVAAAACTGEWALVREEPGGGVSGAHSVIPAMRESSAVGSPGKTLGPRLRGDDDGVTSWAPRHSRMREIRCRWIRPATAANHNFRCAACIRCATLAGT